MSIALQPLVEKYLDIKSASILEIGAYDSPTYTKKEANIKFLDIQKKQELVKDALYFKKDISKIVEVDFYVETNEYDLYITDTFDCIIADNVFEHISNPIKWLITKSKLLNKNGLLFLSLPEYTECFDKFRNPTSFAHIVTDFIRDVPDLDPEHCVESSIYYSLDYQNLPDIYEKLNIDKIKYWYANPHFGIHCHCFEYKTFINKIMKPIILTNLIDFDIVEHVKDHPVDLQLSLERVTQATNH